jgi:hypothetical protein
VARNRLVIRLPGADTLTVAARLEQRALALGRAGGLAAGALVARRRAP